ncbi:hypothetical protein [Nocardia sp. NPDC058633]|uniref:hypothetical protein n=1 Tax=Nocardia sp. NPDC058633 TaxID=3346568 RepID=UPI00365C8D16
MTAPRKTATKRAAPTRPAGVKAPQDHLKPAAQREAEAAEELEFEHKGVTYVGPPNLERTKGVARAIDQQRVTVALELLLSKEEFRKFLDTDPYDSEYAEMLNAWSEAAGFTDLGN